MIYTNTLVNPHDEDGPKMHLWLDGMVDEEDRNEDGLLVPALTAVCGVHIEDVEHPPPVDPHVGPASETWAEGLMDLLGDHRICEECRTRAAVYFDRQDEVTLAATNHEVPECPECESYKRKAAITNIVSKDEGTMVERAVSCHECGHEWEHEINMEALK